MRTFSPAVDIQSKQIVWSCFQNGKQVKHNGEPQVHTSVFLSGIFSDRYSDNVK